MRIGIPRESKPGETLVAATAKTATQLQALGYDVATVGYNQWNGVAIASRGGIAATKSRGRGNVPLAARRARNT